MTDSREIIETLLRYNAWATRRVHACAATLSDEEYFAPVAYSLGSVHAQLAHLVKVQFWWLHYLNDGELRLLDDEDLASRDAILPWLEQTETVAAELLEKLDEEELARETHLPFWEDENACVTVAEGLLQICNHATDHRAQAHGRHPFPRRRNDGARLTDSRLRAARRALGVGWLIIHERRDSRSLRAHIAQFSAAIQPVLSRMIA